MTCSDVERVLPELLDDAPDVAIQTDFEAHLKSCPDCSDLVSDLKLISSEARQLASTDEPASRVWVRIAADLRAEGLIREPESTRPALVPTPHSGWRWSLWWLVPVAASLVAVSSYLVNHKPTPQLAKQQAPASPVVAAASQTPTPETPVAVSHVAPTPAAQQLAPTSAQTAAKPMDNAGTPAGTAVGTSLRTSAESAVASAVEPASSAEDQQFLSEVSTRAPSMRATYENQLRAVNADIRESQAYLDQNPGDPEARQHLMDAYEQKALLYQIALDRIQ
jgi:Putative zinc-finger